MKKAVIIGIILIFSFLLAQIDIGVKTESDEVKSAPTAPVIENSGSLIGNDINRTIQSQGLYFAPGGVRPLEKQMQTFPTLEGIKIKENEEGAK